MKVNFVTDIAMHLTNGDYKLYKLPPAEYLINFQTFTNDVYNKVVSALKVINKKYGMVIVEAKGDIFFEGLEPSN